MQPGGGDGDRRNSPLAAALLPSVPWLGVGEAEWTR